MTSQHASNLPISYVEFLRNLAALSSGPNVTNTSLGLGLPLELMVEPSENTWIDIGCISIEQDSKSGASTLWHSYSDGPYGNPSNPEFFEGEVSVGNWPLEEDEHHYVKHGIDTFTWSLLNALDQALNVSLEFEHDKRICSGLDKGLVALLRAMLIENLIPFESLVCVCGDFARRELVGLRDLLSGPN